ncbi:Tagatose-6-phosphate kinase [Streptomyces tendae]
MILTVTPNPSLDRTYEVPSLDRGEVVRATGERVDPGGKGVNVSRAVTAAGQRTVAVLPLGGAPGALVADLLDAQGIEVAPVPITGPTRSNIALAEADGVLTKINAPGPELSPAERELLLETVRRQSPGADWIACCGSLPRGLAPSCVRRPGRPGARRRCPHRPGHLGTGPAAGPARAARRGQARTPRSWPRPSGVRWPRSATR